MEKPAFRDELRKEDLTDVFFVLSEKKNPRIMKQLNKLSINKAGLFPEIEDVAEYIKDKFAEI